MIEEQAIVTHREGGRVWIRATHNSACGACAQKDGCVTAAFGKAMPKREFAVDAGFDLQVGDSVQVGINTGQLLLGSFLIYIVPLVVMLAVVVLADKFLPNAMPPVWLLPISLAGLMLGFGLLKRMDSLMKFRISVQPQCSGNRLQGVSKISYGSHPGGHPDPNRLD